MPIDTQTLQNRVHTLQKLQEKRLDGKKLSELPDELQITYCRTNQDLGKFSYQCYQAMKAEPDSASLAASYFILAFLKVNNKNAYDEVDKSAKEVGPPQTISNIIPNPDPEEDFKLAIRHLVGIGFPKNKANAIALLKLSAKNNNSNAQALLGAFYQVGKAIPKDHQEANRYLRNAADQGNAVAQTFLGFSYKNGYILTQSDKEASELYKCAAEKGYSYAQIELAEMKETAPKKALQWYRYAAEQGSVVYQYQLAENYEMGKFGASANKQQSARWFRRAAEQGYQKAINKLTRSPEIYFNYHESMLNLDKDGVIHLIRNNPKLSEELVLDLHRATTDSPWLRVSLDVINELIVFETNSKALTSEFNEYYIKFLSSALNDYYIKNVIKIHEQLHLFQEYYDLDTLHYTMNNLSKINALEVALNDINPLINAIVALWYQSKELHNEVKVTSIVGPLLTSLLFKSISANTLKTIDELHNCLLICVKNRFGLEYNIGYTPDRIDEQLTTFLALCLNRQEMTPAEVNRLLGMQFKQLDFQFIRGSKGLVIVLNRLASYVNSPASGCAESPLLAGLKRFLTQHWLQAASPNEATANTVFYNLQQSAHAIKSNKIEFFANPIQDGEVANLFAKIQAGDCDELVSYLDSKESQGAPSRLSNP